MIYLKEWLHTVSAKWTENNSILISPPFHKFVTMLLHIIGFLNTWRQRLRVKWLRVNKHNSCDVFTCLLFFQHLWITRWKKIQCQVPISRVDIYHIFKFYRSVYDRFPAVMMYWPVWIYQIFKVISQFIRHFKFINQDACPQISWWKITFFFEFGILFF